MQKVSTRRFIAGYGLYESQWNIIRGINKTEGHVRTYFETNYRTSRKVVEDLLIEEIIQKAYNLKTGKEKDTEELAQTLLEIREQMVELSEKKQQIASYDRQMDVLQDFIRKFEPLMHIFEMREEMEKKTSVFYHELLGEQERIRELMEELELGLKELRENRDETERKLKTLDLQEIEYAFDDADYERKQKEQESHQIEESLEILKESIVKKESVNYFLNYTKAQSRAKTIEAEIDSLKQGNVELLESIEQMAAQKKIKDENSRKALNVQREETEKKPDRIQRRKSAGGSTGTSV